MEKISLKLEIMAEAGKPDRLRELAITEFDLGTAIPVLKDCRVEPSDNTFNKAKENMDLVRFSLSGFKNFYQDFFRSSGNSRNDSYFQNLRLEFSLTLTLKIDFEGVVELQRRRCEARSESLHQARCPSTSSYLQHHRSNPRPRARP